MRSLALAKAVHTSVMKKAFLFLTFAYATSKEHQEAMERPRDLEVGDEVQVPHTQMV